MNHCRFQDRRKHQSTRVPQHCEEPCANTCTRSWNWHYISARMGTGSGGNWVHGLVRDEEQVRARVRARWTLVGARGAPNPNPTNTPNHGRSSIQNATKRKTQLRTTSTEFEQHALAAISPEDGGTHARGQFPAWQRLATAVVVTPQQAMMRESGTHKRQTTQQGRR